VSARLTAGAQTARSLEDDNLLGLNGLRATLWGAVVSGLRATPRGAVVSGLRATPRGAVVSGLRATPRGAVMSARLNGLRAALSLHSQPPAYLLQPSEACIQPPALVLHAFMQALASHAFSELLSSACIQPPAIVLHAFMQALASHAFSQLLSSACIQPPAIVRGSVA